MRPQPHRPFILTALMLATFVIALEGTVVSAATPAIVSEIGGFEHFSWVLGVYALAQAAAMPIYGKLADAWGRRGLYGWAMLIFLVGSTACGFAPSMPTLIAARAIQGVGAAGLMTVGTTILGDITRADERPRYFAYSSLVWGVAALSGPLIGSLLLQGVGWPWLFWINLPIGMVAGCAVYVGLREVSVDDATKDHNLVGALCLALLLSAVSWALGGQGETVSTNAAVAWLVTLVALLGFLRCEVVCAEPIVPRASYASAMIWAAMASALLCGALTMAVSAFAPVFVSGVLGEDSSRSGMLVATMSISWTVGIAVISRVLPRLRHRPVALVAAGLALTAGLSATWAVREQSYGFLASACIGLGLGLGIHSLLFSTAVQAWPRHHERGRLTSLFYSLRMFGQTLGAAGFASLLHVRLAGRPEGSDATIAALMEASKRAELGADLRTKAVETLASGLASVFFAVSLVAFLLLLSSWFVPRQTKVGDERRHAQT